jgi:predicted metal-dependent hydrolase
MLDRESLLVYALIILIIGIVLRVYFESDIFNLKCIISNVDGNTYCVRERNKIQLVADLLAKVTNKLKQLVSHMKETLPDRENVKRLVENFNPKRICETLPTSTHTAYSENKGEKLAFCVTREKNGTKLIDENTLTFVAIHELAHLATKSIGHKDEFWNNFKFLLEHAKKIGIYNPVDYKKQPQEYCGMKITDNPYYDL